MWITLSLAATLVVALLYIPGFFFWRGLRFSRMLSLCCAPLFSAATFGLLAAVYYELGIPCSFASVFTPTLLLALAAFALRQRSDAPEKDSVSLPYRSFTLAGQAVSLDKASVFLYVFVACLTIGLLFIRNLATPNAFFQLFDNQTHLNAIRAFLDSGKWSAFHETSYPCSPLYAIPSESNVGSFYPTGWHIMAAMACEVLRCEPIIGMNATIVPICVLVLPLSMFLYLRALFPKRSRVVLLGALAVWLFPNWPWDCLITGPLYPNLYGLAMLPTAAALALILTDIDRKDGEAAQPIGTPAGLLTTFVALVALVSAHPNTLFSLFVFLVFYQASTIARTPRNGRFQKLPEWLRSTLPLIAYLIVITLIWAFFYHVPWISNVIDFKPEVSYEATSATSALHNVLSGLYAQKEYLASSFVVLIACILALRSTSRWPIIVLPVAYFSFAYASIYAGIPLIAHWTSAPWYSDPRRLALNIAVFGTPLMALMLDYVVSTLNAMRNGNAQQKKPAARSLCTCIAFIGFISISLFVGFRRVNTTLHKGYDQYARHVYNVKEQRFVSKALEITGSDLVLNSPNDGSMWAYGYNGMNTYFRNIRLTGHQETAKLIRLHLAEYASDASVREAVAHTGAKYVLLLDMGAEYRDGMWLKQYGEADAAEWAGIDAIDDLTPGFELVLSESDDMRLYRIVGQD